MTMEWPCVICLPLTLLAIADGGIESYTDVVQNAKYTGTEVLKKLPQLWKICYLGNGFYSIRPMNKSDMGMDVTRGNADIYKINTTDTLSGVINDAKWSIEWRTDGYTLYNNDDTLLTLQVSGADRTVNANNPALTEQLIYFTLRK